MAAAVAAEIKLVGVWDTVGSIRNPVSRMTSRVARYRCMNWHSAQAPSRMHPIRAQVADSYTGFGPWLLRQFTPRFHRPVGPAPSVGTKLTASRVNETIDGSVFDRWWENAEYRPATLKAWAEKLALDSAAPQRPVRALDGTFVVAGSTIRWVPRRSWCARGTARRQP